MISDMELLKDLDYDPDTGVQWNKAHAAWHVRIGVGGKYKHLGYFKDFNEAVAVRKEAEVHYGYHENHGRDAV